MKSLLEQLPSIVAEGKKEAERVMERAESSYRLGLQTRELVIPSKDSNWHDLFRKTAQSNNSTPAENSNSLIYGDNMLAMAALLAGDQHRPSLRSSIQTIYLGSGLIDQSQKITVAARAMAERKTIGHLS